MKQEVMCACLIVRFSPDISYGPGFCKEKWRCESCGSEFIRKGCSTIDMLTAERDAIIEYLARTLNYAEQGKPLLSNQGQALDGYSELAEYRAIAKKARNLLKHEESIQ